MTITYRDQLSRDLTPAEVDANFRHVLDGANTTVIQSGTGSVAEALESRARWLLYLTDKLSDADRASLRAGTFVDATTALNNCITDLPATGGGIEVPRGAYILDDIQWPDFPKHVALYCQPGTIFKAKNANTSIFKGCANVTATVGTGCYDIYGFPYFQAHASGSTGPALDLRNWSHSRLEIGGFLANGAGTWNDGMLYDASGGKHCYDNDVMAGMRAISSTPCARSFIRVEGNANRHYVGKICAVATAVPKLFSFADSASISDWTIDRPYCEGWTGTTPAVIDVGDGNIDIHVQRPYFEDVIKAFDETATSRTFINFGTFAASPGVSQGTALPANYHRLGNTTGGANVNNAIDTTNVLHLLGGGAIRIYDSANSAFMTIAAFAGVKMSMNYPFETTGGTVSALMGGSSTVAPAIVKANVTTTNVGNVGVGEDDLMVYALPANALSANGRGVKITAWGITANNSNTKTVKLYFGSLAIITTALTVSQAGVWRIEATVVRTGVDAQDYSAQLVQGGTTTLVDVEAGTHTQDDGAIINIKCTGTVVDGGGGVNNDDIVQQGMTVVFLS